MYTDNFRLILNTLDECMQRSIHSSRGVGVANTDLHSNSHRTTQSSTQEADRDEQCYEVEVSCLYWSPYDCNISTIV